MNDRIDAVLVDTSVYHKKQLLQIQLQTEIAYLLHSQKL